ncbi:MAG: class I SAM-dependent methyltransferase [Caulobacterales bacterium]|nr:class I SAM-dependent methyltransferase [Caulobacterales bacterium]
MKRLIAAAALVLAGCATTADRAAEVAALSTAGVASAAEAAVHPAVTAAQAASDRAAAREAAGPARWQAAIGDPRRPEGEVARDPLRHPFEMLEFIELRPGQRIADIRPEEGYFTRLFAPVVGETGQVYAFVPTLTAGREQAFAEGLQAEYGNVTPVIGLLDEMRFDAPLDVVFMGQEYHDFHIERFDVDVAEMNRRVFAALRPGGIYVILDHSGRTGTGNTEVQTLHRIEGAFLRREVEAAGFIYEGQTRVVANPDDPMDISVFDESIRGRSDQFVYRFRRPETAIDLALTDDRRPDADRERDWRRRSVDLLTLAQVESGDRVADLIIGGGYFTRIFAALVGSEGHVTAWQPAEFIGFNAEYGQNLTTLDEAYDNVSGVNAAFADLAFAPNSLDVAFTAQNYHDFHLEPFPEDTAAGVNAAVFAGLRPCGRYVVIDHDAAADTGFSAAHTLHRIDRAAAQAEIEQAGFRLIGSSNVLANPDDPLTADVFDASIRGRTSQFALVFQKPGDACPAG